MNFLDRLLSDLEWLGFLFESLVILDLRVLAQAMDGEIFHYRDKYGVEVDAIVQFCEQIDTQRTGEPAFFLCCRWERWNPEV